MISHNRSLTVLAIVSVASSILVLGDDAKPGAGHVAFIRNLHAWDNSGLVSGVVQKGQRFPAPPAKPREKASVWIMNLAVLAVAAGLIAIFGFLPWSIIQLIAIAVAGSAGIWLFYVQHQFEGAYWERGEDWDFTDAALKGSSFYKLPKIQC